MSQVRWFRRVLVSEVPTYVAAGWTRVARDWSDSVGELALVEWHHADAPPEDNRMTNLPTMGDRVRIWPALGARVQDGAASIGRMLPLDGREVSWDAYWHRRYLEGSILFHDPQPVAPSPKR